MACSSIISYKCSTLKMSLIYWNNSSSVWLKFFYACDCPAVLGSSPVVSSRSVIRSPQVEESSQLTTASSNGSIPPPPPPSPLPPPILPTTVRGPSQPPSAPASLPGSPDRILTTHVLTHLIEGFVIREGLEPFPVSYLEVQGVEI